jgi:hypothetical protein
MKMKFGALVVAGSGKIGGQVASRNRAGAYLRTKSIPVNPQTASQSAVRSRLASISQSWRDLTAAQRAAWNGSVSNFQKTDVFGDLRNPTGFNLYQRLNNNLAATTGSAITTPPVPTEVLSVTLSSITSTASDALGLVLSGSVPAGTSMKIFATPPVSAGVSFVKSEYRLIGVSSTGAASPIDLHGAYTTKFGASIVGQKIFARVTFVDNASGLETPPQSASVITIA